MARTATVSGPIIGGSKGSPWGASSVDLSEFGYVEEEFFLDGEACMFEPVGELKVDGHWLVRPAAAFAYRTRILVRRPARAEDFNGTVVVTWTNVSGGLEILTTPTRLAGFAYVGVSCQPTGITGYASSRRGLHDWDPERYSSLHIANDGVGYDIFTQAARAIGPDREGAVDPMGELPVRRLVAMGASQSGTRILAYLNGVHPLERVFDAFVPSICAGMAGDFAPELAHPDPAEVKHRDALLSESEKTDPDAAIRESRARGHSRSLPALVRDDLGTPVLAVNTETEAFAYLPRRQPDTELFRYWEVAGAAHASRGGLGSATRGMSFADLPGLTQQGGVVRNDVNMSAVYEAVVEAVHQWLTTNEPPAVQPRIDIDGQPPAIVRDEHGNAVGGIRLPELEVPIATYRGMDDRGSIAGQKIAFAPEKVQALYASHEDYVSQVEAAAKDAVQRGVILPEAVEEYVQLARATSW